MEDRYRKWIDNKLATGADPFVACAEWTEEMHEAFPELTRVRGEVLLSNGWARNHWWLVDINGGVVDPTSSQFQQEYYGGKKTVVLHYSPRDESEPEPTGMCPNCGGMCYDGGTCCSDACHNAYAAYCMSGGSW